LIVLGYRGILRLTLKITTIAWFWRDCIT